MNQFLAKSLTLFLALVVVLPATGCNSTQYAKEPVLLADGNPALAPDGSPIYKETLKTEGVGFSSPNVSTGAGAGNANVSVLDVNGLNRLFNNSRFGRSGSRFNRRHHGVRVRETSYEVDWKLEIGNHGPNCHCGRCR